MDIASVPTAVSADVSPSLAYSHRAALENERFYRHVIDSTVDGFFMVDTRHRFVEVNDKMCQLFGYAREEWLGRTPLDFVTRDSQEELQRQITLIDKTERRCYQLVALRKDGSTFPMLINTTTHRNSQGEVVGSFGFATDLTSIAVAQRAVAESERELRRILDSMQDTYYRTNLEGHLVRISASVHELLGYTPEECRGLRLADLYVDANGRADFLEALQAGNGRVSGYEAQLRHKKGHAVWVMTNAQHVKDETGKVIGVEGTTRDISDRRMAQERIDFLAHHDPLTELPNRLLFKDRFERAVVHDQRTGTRTALLFIDLDRFKPINDTYGHQAGDIVLREVGKRLQSCMRGSDNVSRQGGDEFIVTLTDLHSNEAAAQVAEKLLQVLTQPFVVEGHEMMIGSSIGIVLCPDHGRDFEDLLRKADAAMYGAKRAGGNAYRFHGAA